MLCERAGRNLFNKPIKFNARSAFSIIVIIVMRGLKQIYDAGQPWQLIFVRIRAQLLSAAVPGSAPISPRPECSDLITPNGFGMGKNRNRRQPPPPPPPNPAIRNHKPIFYAYNKIIGFFFVARIFDSASENGKWQRDTQPHPTAHPVSGVEKKKPCRKKSAPGEIKIDV